MTYTEAQHQGAIKTLGFHSWRPVHLYSLYSNTKVCVLEQLMPSDTSQIMLLFLLCHLLDYQLLCKVSLQAN